MLTQHLNLWDVVQPHPKQREFWKVVQRCSYILYGGARGGGKSYILRWTLVKLLVEWFMKWGHKNVRVGMFCEDYPTLKDRQIVRVRIEFPEWLGKWNGEDKEFRLVKDLGSGVIAFRNLDDPSKYMCYHPATEVLAETGFVRIGTVRVGDRVATFDPETRMARYAPVTKVWRYDFDGELVSTVDGKQHAAFTVTPNHQILARTARGSLKLYRADDLPAEFHVPRCARWPGGKHPTDFQIPTAFLGRKKKRTRFDIKPWLEFLGWYIAEGSLGSRLRYQINISQAKKPERDRIRSVLERLGYRFYEDDKGFRLYGKALFKYLKQFGGSHQKHVPRQVFSFDSSLLRYLFDELMAGDGHQYESGRYVYVTSSRQLVDDVSELAIRLGLVPTIIPIPDEHRQGYPGTGPAWHVSISERGDTRITETVRQAYEGPVYCITVPPHHTVMIRYRNRVMWCGQSAEFAAMAVDQLEKNPSGIFDILRGSLRWPGIHDTKFLAAANPGGIGHLWVRSYFKDRELPRELQVRRDQFAYVQALPRDNPHNSPEYIAELESLPPKLRRAWMEGDWDVFEGQVFEEWREDLHVLEEFRVPPNWSWAGGLDFGHREHGWLGMFASGGANESVCVDEFVFKDVYADEAGYQAGLRLANYPPLEYIGADEEMFWQTGIGPTKAEEFQRGLDRAMSGRAPRLIRITHGKGSRSGRLELFHRLLAWKKADNGTVPPWWQPKLKYHKRCRYAIRTIPALSYDPKRSEDVDTDGEDHGYDGSCYWAMSRPPVGEPIPALAQSDTHPGLDRSGRRRKPYIESQMPQEEHPIFRMPREFEPLRDWV